MNITFYGAAQTVTGSKHLIEVDGFRILLDCGLHQGRREESNTLNRNLPFPASSIDAVILSHAHMDHSGMLPVLVRDGFKGKIYCTAPTADITKLILEDAGMIQEQDALYYNKHLKPDEKPIEPLYTPLDVKAVGVHFHPVPYFRLHGSWTEITPNIRFKFYDAGHILGSAITLLEIREKGETKRLIFTGDLGRHFLPILRDPEYVEEPASVLITEATYGGRVHRPVTDLEQNLEQIITEAVARRSKIIVPAFSLGRTQELMYVLHKLIDAGKIPAFPIYIDSPLAQKITRVFDLYSNDFDEEFWEDFGEKGERAFVFKNLKITSSARESQAINAVSGPCMVIAGSGMCEGGRILHHLKNNIENPDTVVLITGYQGQHTLGRKLLEGVSPVRIFGQTYDMKARVIALNELSAHADQRDLLQYVQHTRGLQNLFLVHGELEETTAFKNLVNEQYPDIAVHIPALGDSFTL